MCMNYFPSFILLNAINYEAELLAAVLRLPLFFCWKWAKTFVVELAQSTHDWIDQIWDVIKDKELGDGVIFSHVNQLWLNNVPVYSLYMERTLKVCCWQIATSIINIPICSLEVVIYLCAWKEGIKENYKYDKAVVILSKQNISTTAEQHPCKSGMWGEKQAANSNQMQHLFALQCWQTFKPPAY